MAGDRRQHIRVRPAADLPVTAELVEGAAPGPLSVVDISFGGMAFQTAGGLRDVAIGDRLGFDVVFGRGDPIRVHAVVKHGSGENPGLTGVEFDAAGEDVARAIRRYVSELFERGLSV